MTVLSITCDNCGAKYKLPETFTGAQAKCQKCGSVIDVAKQRAAATAAPAAAAATAPKAAAQKPAAAARPAVDRSKSEPKPATERPARSARADKAKEASAAAVDDSGGKGKRGARGERPERPEKKKSSTMPLVLSGLGLVVIIGVAWMVMGGGDKPKTDDTAKRDGAAPAAAKPADTPAEKPADKPAETPAEKPAAPAAGKAADQPATPTATDKPVEPAAKPADPKPADASTPPADAPPTDPGRPLKMWEKLKGINSMVDVRDPTSYPEVAWPASIDDAKKAEIRGLCDDVKSGGKPGIKAKPKLSAIGYGSLFGIVETLRTLDYKSEGGNEVAFELNKLLEEVTGGLNTGFEPIEVGEPIDPRKAEYNTRTVGAWRKMLDKFPDEEAFKKDRAERLKKQAEK